MPDPSVIRGPMLNPRGDGSIEFIRDGAIGVGADGRITSVNSFDRASRDIRVRTSEGIILPPLLDAHIHIPQHPIRGGFMEGVAANPDGGRLIAGLNRNVFPTEAKCASREYTERVVRDFLEDTLAHGVVGGCAYMTVHPDATRVALEMLPQSWSVGLVLMEMNCPEYLRTDASAEQHMR